MKTYTFSVSEVFKDGRVLVFTYARQGTIATVLMQVFDEKLQNPVTALNFSIPTK